MHPSVKRVSTRESLLQAAIDELTDTGTLEVAAVSKRAGVSVGLPYRYFGTRAGLLVGVLDDFYARLGDAAAMRIYDDPSWIDREQRRIRDWVDTVYSDPLAALILGGLVGEANVAEANIRHLRNFIAVGAHNIRSAQRTGEIPGHRDADMLAAAILGGTNAILSLVLTREPRPTATIVADELWATVRGIVGPTTRRSHR